MVPGSLPTIPGTYPRIYAPYRVQLLYCTPCVHLRTTFRHAHRGGLSVTSTRVGIPGKKGGLFHLRINPSRARKGVKRGKETRHRESCCTRPSGILQPLLNCSQTPLKVLGRLFSPEGRRRFPLVYKGFLTKSD